MRNLISKILAYYSNMSKKRMTSLDKIPDPYIVVNTLDDFANRSLSPSKTEGRITNLILNTISGIMSKIQFVAISFIGYELYMTIRTNKTIPEKLVAEFNNINFPESFHSTLSTQKHDKNVPFFQSLYKAPMLASIIIVIFATIIKVIADRMRERLNNLYITDKHLRNSVFANSVLYYYNNKVYPKNKDGIIYVKDTTTNVLYKVDNQGNWYPNAPEHLLKKIFGIRKQRSDKKNYLR